MSCGAAPSPCCRAMLARARSSRTYSGFGWVGRLGCGAVAAAVAWPAVNPVGVHAPFAEPAADQLREHVVAPGPVGRFRCCVDGLGGDEVGFADQGRMGSGAGDDPLTVAVSALDRPSAAGAFRGVVVVGASAVPDPPPGAAGFARIAATVRKAHPSAERCWFRAGSLLDGHRTPRSFSSRAIPAALRPVRRSANIHRTYGAEPRVVQSLPDRA